MRRALTLAIDRWRGAPAMSKISVMKTVGGVGFPGSPLAATKEELQQLAGYWPDIEKSRAEARRLLKEAGQEHLSFELLNRPLYNYWGVREGQDWQWPPVANAGAKVMLMNGWSGSGAHWPPRDCSAPSASAGCRSCRA